MTATTRSSGTMHHSASLPTLPSPSSTFPSVIKTVLALLCVTGTMVLETMATLSLFTKLVNQFTSTDWRYLPAAVYSYQFLTFALSPFFLRQANRARPDTEQAAVLELWNNAAPLKSLKVGFLTGGQALSWDFAGKLFFAPAMFKMGWAGKTITSDSTAISMLEFSSINLLPVPKFGLVPLATATLINGTVDGVSSLALAYNYLPIVDHLRRLDETTIIGKMMIGNVHILYFTLYEREKKA